MSVRLGAPQAILRARASSDDFNQNPYEYLPTEWICILFLVLFSLSTALHFVETVHTRLWWLLPTVCTAGALEILGWVGRLWSSLNVDAENPYLMQIVTTIIAPTPLVAANFVILGELIRRLGPRYSRLSPMFIRIPPDTAVFDIISLVVQAVGGGIAATAVNQYESPATGGNIMLAGIAFQMASITVYMLLAAEFVLRFLHDKPVRNVVHAAGHHHFNRSTKLMLAGLTFSSLCIYVRSVYRTIELAEGWDGYIITTQHYFNWLDGGMITLAMFCLNVLHPGYLLGKRETWKASRGDSEKLNSEPATPVKTVVSRRYP
ncbi:RTA1 like protein-domain-containing protein [Fomitopsis serialis]|uniref:RTA1 like protein-domain-containing protein n=1 Tax=Fomitopsis serialis TaxID=139415 RepID=UPI00200739AC|nr:RTA1 like protein-domain-containing protein [Neoantrodia serialis]KAH9912222.1 RTA1 like protein-domain-containing protein [Neoantrodia serialis]